MSPEAATWIRAQGFKAERHRLVVLPGAAGRLGGAVLGLGALADLDSLDPWMSAGCAERLPPASYELQTALAPEAATQFLLGWLLGSYQFQVFKAEAKMAALATLVPPPAADSRMAAAVTAAIKLARDLINTPANALGPIELAQAAEDLARRTGGSFSTVSGAALAAGYPLISAVGQGSDRAPLLIDCRWARNGAPKVTLVGKGVCFDTGGLDVKPAAGMLLMKKDMGGAACVLALAQLIRANDLPIDLRVLIPAVENSIGSRSYRPGDVWSSRKGLRVEIGNTDAEGRLVLADAIADAVASGTDLLIDLATLTGAARTALGPELPALFSNREQLADDIRAAGVAVSDPLWPMPLWSGYDDELSSRIADLNNVSGSAFAGAIIAALFLQRFVSPATPWVHIDLYAWNAKERPGRPVGAEAHAVRALFEFLRRRYAPQPT
jgi:leucyl aminopeptidase